MTPEKAQVPYATDSPVLRVQPEPGTQPSKHPQQVGLVLSGGGARGFAHLGVLKVLEQKGIPVDLVAGTSVGAIIGAFVAHGYAASELYRLATNTPWRELFDLSLSSASLFKGAKLEAFLRHYLPERFEDLKKPLAVLATDLRTGEEIMLHQGDLIQAIRASSCFPGVFDPVRYKERLLVDGGLLNNLPVSAADFLGAHYVIASDVTVPRYAVPDKTETSKWRRTVELLELKRRPAIASATLRSVDIMQSVITETRYAVHPANLRIKHRLGQINIEDFWKAAEIAALGEQQAERSLQGESLGSVSA